MAQKMMNSVTARRSFVLLGIFALFSLCLAGVVFKMQVFEYDRYQEEVLNQITVENTVAAKRGTIYDRNMNVIATNQTMWRVFISPVDIQSAVYSSAIERAIHRVRYGDDASEAVASGRQDELIASGLSEILGVDYDFVLKKTTLTGRRDETIKKNVDKDTADRVLAFIEDNGLKNQVHLEATNKRYYPSGNMAAQTIGFTGADGQGLYGLEYYYNEELTGVAGRYIIAQDARGNEMAYNYESYVEPINGYHMVSTIDPQIQHELDVQVEATLHNSVAQNRACGIAMNPKTGEILGISVKPDFDLNSPYVLDELSALLLDDCGFEEDSEEYNKFLAELRQVMWSNKAITELYEPGSTFKIITSSMALEEKVVSPTEVFTCTGVLEVGGFKIHCHKRTGHGTVTFARGLQQSCNPILMTIAARVGSEKFYSYFESFGYLDKTGIDLPGEARTIFHAKGALGTTELATASFGQRFKVSPISQLTAICAVANGGYLVTPHLLDRFVDDDGVTVKAYGTAVKRQVISTETARTLTQILEAGVSGDGGAKNAYVKGYKVAAKTGTSEKFDEPEKELRIGSCVAYAPADDPQIAVLIMVDEPTGGSVYGSIVAAPYVSAFLSNVLPYMGIEPEYSEEELAKLQVSVGRYIGSSVEDAKAKIKELGVTAEIIGGGDTVTGQVPARGSKLEKEHGKIILYTNDADPNAKTVKVPNVLGLTAAQANEKIIAAGLNIEIKGSQNYQSGGGATVTSQSYAGGTDVPYGTVVTIEVLHTDMTD